MTGPARSFGFLGVGAGHDKSMLAARDAEGKITDRDLQRVMAARRALHAYQPYAPPSRTPQRYAGAPASGAAFMRVGVPRGATGRMSPPAS